PYAHTCRDSSGDVLYVTERNRSHPRRPGESEAASSGRSKRGCRRDQARERASFIPPVASTSTRSIRNRFSGSTRTTPSGAAVTVQPTATLRVAPDGSVTTWSARGASGEVAAAPGAGPEGGAAQPDSIPAARSTTPATPALPSAGADRSRRRVRGPSS